MRGEAQGKAGTDMQTTIKSAVTFDGVGLHTGRRTRITLRPASAEFGIWFRRTDVEAHGLIAARWDQVVASQLCTRIANTSGVSVTTIEHVMAAIAGCGITNLLVEINGPEVPILDGSAAPFVRGILAHGVRVQDAPVRALRLLETVEVRNGAAYARLEPAETLEIAFRIDFADSAIGRQEKHLVMSNGTFVHELADSRTFCLNSDVARMKASGLALGGSYDNAVVVDGDRILTPGGLRHADEAVRHKMLDALGDLALAGAPLLARYTAERAGHAMTNALLRTLFARPTAFRMVELSAGQVANLPGAGVSQLDLAPAA
jgi:UDP-3-O-[3-hydroxymyristoyl] N-acetylglucosamine deacetylase